MRAVEQLQKIWNQRLAREGLAVTRPGLSPLDRRILAWRRRRDKIASALICDTGLSSADAISRANNICGPMPGR